VAAGSTYSTIATTTLGSAAASYTFSSISGSYTDLVLIADNVGSSASIVDLRLQFNGDTGSNYSFTSIYGSGSLAGSYRGTSTSFIKISYSGGSEKPMVITNIQNYSNSTTYKTALVRQNTTTNTVEAIVGLWRNTAAITSITISYSSGNLSTGSTFTLYGIAAA
jgi:hypothetical protein